MNWEALTAVGTFASAIVIAVTVVVAARQMRVTSEQLAQMRRATQFDAARTVLAEMNDPVFVDAYKFVYNELPSLLKDEAFHKDLALIGVVDERVHKEVAVLRAFDRIGTYVRFGLVEGDIIYSTFGPRIVICWELLAEPIAVHRWVAGVPMYDNFEFLVDDCKRWQEQKGRRIDPAASRDRVNAHRGKAARTDDARAAETPAVEERV